jgi:hypothetical protein
MRCRRKKKVGSLVRISPIYDRIGYEKGEIIVFDTLRPCFIPAGSKGVILQLYPKSKLLLPIAYCLFGDKRVLVFLKDLESL